MDESRSPPAAEGADPVMIETVADWLTDQALADMEVDVMVDGLCDRLHAVGVPIWRAHITYRTIHPLHGSRSVTWHRERSAEVASHPRAFVGRHAPAGWRESPLYHLIHKRLNHLRRRLDGPEALLDFPLLRQLSDDGGTDYLAFSAAFGEGLYNGMAGSFATDREGGFSDAHLRTLLGLRKPLGMAIKIRVQAEIARNVVRTYLGPRAGLRVLNGQIQRGDGETIPAALWYSDLRGSTAMADRMETDAFIAMLNGYFEATAGAVLNQDGEILGFIGDAVLAIFPADGGEAAERAACARALAAADEATGRMAGLNEERAKAGAEALSFGLGLHFGDVMFGNIGVAERLTFNVIGRTVNEVCRLEELTREDDGSVLASAAFAARIDADWPKIGERGLRGVGRPITVHRPPGD